ncbi:TPA: esterase-like activity of phytase family protein [Escherichia coli]
MNDSRNNNKEGDASLYTLKIQVSSRGIEQVNFLNQRPLLDAKQQPFVTNTVDAEGLALTHNGKSLLWSSELGAPLRLSTLDGVMEKDFTSLFPARFNISSDKESSNGIRSGNAWEGLTVTPDGKSLFIAVESSLQQDGPIASPINSGTSRLLQFSIDADGRPSKQLHEYLYITDPVPQVSKFGINDNGVSEVLALNDHQLLVIERSGRNVSAGFNDWDYSVRVYMVDLTAASDIKDIDSLQDWSNKSTLQPVSKKLLIDFADYTSSADCIEGVTFGPLIDGHTSLIFVSDNNFQPHQQTKFYLFIDKENKLKI